MKTSIIYYFNSFMVSNRDFRCFITAITLLSDSKNIPLYERSQQSILTRCLSKNINFYTFWLTWLFP